MALLKLGLLLILDLSVEEFMSKINCCFQVQTLKFERQFDDDDVKQELPTDHLVKSHQVVVHVEDLIPSYSSSLVFGGLED